MPIHFAYTNAFVKRCNTFGVFDEIQNTVEENMDFLHPQVNNGEIINFMNKVTGNIENHFIDVWDKQLLSRTMVVASKFCIPLADMEGLNGAGDAKATPMTPTDWILKGDVNIREGLCPTDWLMCPMIGSVMFNATQKKAQKKRGKPGKITEQETKAALMAEELDPNIGGRPRMWLDDVLLAITTPLGRILPEAEVAKSRSFEHALCLAFRYCWSQNVTVGGKEVKSWKVMREMIKADLVREHVRALQDACLADAHHINLSEASSETITEHILKVLSGGEGMPEAAEHPAVKEIKDFFAHGEDRVLTISQYLSCNKLEAPVKFHPAFQSMVTGVSFDLKILDHHASSHDNSQVFPGDVAPEDDKVEHAIQTVSMKDIAASVATRVRTAVPDWCNELAKLLVLATKKTGDHIRDLSEGLFQTDVELVNFTLLSARYILEIMKSLSCGVQRLTSDDYKPLVTLLEIKIEDVALAEGRMLGKDRDLFLAFSFGFSACGKVRQH